MGEFPCNYVPFFQCSAPLYFTEQVVSVSTPFRLLHLSRTSFASCVAWCPLLLTSKFLPHFYRMAHGKVRQDIYWIRTTCVLAGCVLRACTLLLDKVKVAFVYLDSVHDGTPLVPQPFFHIPSVSCFILHIILFFQHIMLISWHFRVAYEEIRHISATGHGQHVRLKAIMYSSGFRRLLLMLVKQNINHRWFFLCRFWYITEHDLNNIPAPSAEQPWKVTIENRVGNPVVNRSHPKPNYRSRLSNLLVIAS